MDEPEVPVIKTPADRSAERLDLMANLTVEVLIERLQSRTATSAEIVAAMQYMKNAGVTFSLGSLKKIQGAFQRDLPKFDESQDKANIGG